MNAVVETPYTWSGRTSMISNEETLRPDFLFSGYAAIWPTIMPQYGNIGVLPFRNSADLIREFSATPINVIDNKTFPNQPLFVMSYSQFVQGSNNISWMDQQETVSSGSAESFWTSLSLHTLLDQFRRSSFVRYAARLAARLETLYRESLTDGEAPLSLESTASFLSFLKYAGSVSYPDVTLTPSGHIYATWGRTAARKLSLQFGDSRVKYVFLYRNDPSDVFSAKGLGELPSSDMLLIINQMPQALRDVIFTNG